MKPKKTTRKAQKTASAKHKGRDTRGRFVEGNPGGPGRPRRAVEREYLAAISDAVPLNLWRGIVLNVVGCAEDGERWAIEWLAKYLLGEPQGVSLTLTELATREHLGIDVERELEAEADALKNPPASSWLTPTDAPTVVGRALRLEADRQKSEAHARIESEPDLQPCREVIEQGADWNFDDTVGYWRWIATAPVREVVEWAKENPDDGAAQAQANIERAIAGDTEAARRIREITEA
jgi:hypothetical protein